MNIDLILMMIRIIRYQRVGDNYVRNTNNVIDSIDFYTNYTG